MLRDPKIWQCVCRKVNWRNSDRNMLDAPFKFYSFHPQNYNLWYPIRFLCNSEILNLLPLFTLYQLPWIYVSSLRQQLFLSFLFIIVWTYKLACGHGCHGNNTINCQTWIKILASVSSRVTKLEVSLTAIEPTENPPEDIILYKYGTRFSSPTDGRKKGRFSDRLDWFHHYVHLYPIEY